MVRASAFPKYRPNGATHRFHIGNSTQGIPMWKTRSPVISCGSGFKISWGNLARLGCFAPEQILCHVLEPPLFVDNMGVTSA